MTSPFAQLPPVPASHFALCFYGALLRLRGFLGPNPAPALASYWRELDAAPEARSTARWRAALLAWEASAPVRLPIASLREDARLDDDAVDLLLTVAMPDEDARLGAVFEALGGSERPTVGVLGAIPGLLGSGDALQRLAAAGLVTTGAGVPRPRRPVALCDGIGEALRGGAPQLDWLRRAPAAEHDLIAPADVIEATRRLPGLLADGATDTVVVRGPATSGRRTLLAGVARDRGLGVLQVEPEAIGDERWPVAGALALLLGALPVVALDPGPSEVVRLPAMGAYSGPLGVTMPRAGGLEGPRAERAVTLELPLPDSAARAAHWRAAMAGTPGPDADEVAAGRRMTGGNLRRTASLARASAALAGRTEVTHEDVRAATRALHGRLLDAHAERVAPAGGWGDLAVPPATRRELELLADRCRRREALRDALGGGGGAGVRALLSGPSGTGKTLAARAMAAELERDLYRVDLTAIVDKYVGESEKNLAQLLARAEEADVALLLDEGDALLGKRTAVHTSVDRYANLETNYLLQRLDEGFEGLLIVTTNAGERIDGAFRRRMDVVIELPAPDAEQRWAIWHVHLPAGHGVGAGMLEQVAVRCTLTGGQIRNAVVHATLLALDDGAIGDAHLDAALRREYRKSGRVCPLPAAALNGHG